MTKNYELYGHLAKWKKENDKIFWNVNKNGVCSSQIIYKNGLKKELTVNFLSPDDSKVKISEICRRISVDDEVPADKIDIDYLNQRFAEIIQPDPDLAIYFGEICCTFGLLPWHIRLTEFFNISSQTNLNLSTFMNSLFAYSGCEQRFGH